MLHCIGHPVAMAMLQSGLLGGRAQLTSFRTRFGGATPANGLPEGVPWVDVL